MIYTMETSAPPLGIHYPTYELEHSTNTPKQYNKLKCTPCRIRKKACYYGITNPNEPCQLCLVDPHELDCGPKIRVSEDERWAEWSNTEAFFSEVRQLVKLRLQQGESQEDIRRLLQVPKGEGRASLITNNSDPFSTISPLSHQTVPQEEISVVPSSPDTSQMQWNHGGLPINYPTIPITPFASRLSVNSSTAFQPQLVSPGTSSVGYLPSAAVGQSSPNFSNAIPQNDVWLSHNFSQYSNDGNFLSQFQSGPNEYFDSYGNF